MINEDKEGLSIRETMHILNSERHVMALNEKKLLAWQKIKTGGWFRMKKETKDMHVRQIEGLIRCNKQNIGIYRRMLERKLLEPA